LVLNEYLKGKSELPASSIFFAAGKEATLADSLLPIDDPRKKSNQVMAAFHKAFSYIRYDQFEKYPEAEYLLRNAIRLEDRAAYLYVTMGYLMQYQHKYDSAIYFVQKAADIIPTWNHPKNVLGNLYADIHQYDKALSFHESVINRDSSYVWSYNNIGVSLLDMGRLKEAEYYFMKSLQKKKETGKERLNRDWATSYTNLAVIMEERGLPAKALQYYNLSDSVDASYTVAMRNRARLNKNLKQDLSELVLKKAIEIMPFEAANFYELGEFYRIYNQNKADLVIADSLYKKAVALNPFNEAFYDGLAMLYYDKGEKDSAYQLLQKAITISNASSEAYFNMGYLYGLQSQRDSSLKYYKLALQKNPFNLDFAVALADAQLLNKDTMAAEATMLQSQILHPNSPKSFYFVGNFYFKISQFNKAVKAYESCIEADSSFYKGIQAAAYVNLMSGNFVKSRKMLQQLLRIYQDEGVKLQYMNLVAEAFLKQPIDKRLVWIKPFLTIDPNHELVNELMAETAYETVKDMRSVYTQVKATEASLEYNNPVLIKWLLLMCIELNNVADMKLYAQRYLDETLNTDPVLKAVSFKIVGQLTEARKAKKLVKNSSIPSTATKLLQIFKSI
jgi:tetratricopeptide (TPR) repeat protein